MRYLSVVVLLWSVAPAAAKVAISVDLSSQTMHVSADGAEYDWPVSTARSGFSTPRGSYGVQRLEAMHRSRQYHDSPMPHSIFFSGGYAIHGTEETGSLGRPASHGCIRLDPEDAALLYDLVEEQGATITIHGSPPRATRVVHRRHREYDGAYADRGDPYYDYNPGRPAVPARSSARGPGRGSWNDWPD